MNRIEKRLALLEEAGHKAFITYMTAGLPDIERCAELIRVQEEAGTDILELGIPFSDPVADGPVIQDASFRSIQKGTNLKKVFDMVEKLRTEGCEIPLVFMMYYNTVSFYGLAAFAAKCAAVGIDGLIIPDLPYEEQGNLKKVLDKTSEAPILIQLVAPVSKQRIPMILKNARGFVYCVSSMGVTGQDATFHKDILQYLQKVRSVSTIPVMMGFGIRTAQDIMPMKDVIDGCIVGSHFIQLMEQNQYNTEVIKEYITTFKNEMNGVK
ncbi:MAG: tryptophan synthase subunit alpha [Lachnospiraceae bacterium]|nr:tryptophan synthase subunit alpha [Lachnospiraceae bacterium]MDD3660372.1 tryptophan synthase subunit alpha [Lachnospiraceae bacterium]